jgi:hypothetical protein
MDWTLFIIGTLTALLVVVALHLIWKERSHTSQRMVCPYQCMEKGFVPVKSILADWTCGVHRGIPDKSRDSLQADCVPGLNFR